MRGAAARSLLLTLAAVAAIWLTSPAQAAQLAAGCVCPAGLVPVTSTTCAPLVTSKPTAAAICPGRNIGHIAANVQQQSFWGISQILQQKRDQLQSTPVPGASSRISGYSSSVFDAGPSSLSYSSQGQKNNPLAGGLYDVAPSPAQPNPAWGVSLQGSGDTEHDNPLAITDAAHLTNTYAAQATLDRTQQAIFSADDAWVLGIVSSWTNTHTGYGNSAATMDLSGPGVGVFSAYVKGGFSTDLAGKFDFLQIKQDFAGAAPNQSIGITSEGLSGNAQYKIKGLLGSDSNFFEPTVGFTLSHVSFNGAGALELEDSYTVKLQAGARLGTTWDAGHGVSVDASLKALAYGNAVAQGTSTAGATDPGNPFNTPLSPTDAGLLRGELDPELCFNLPENYSVSVSGQVRYGGSIVGGSAGINLRKQW